MSASNSRSLSVILRDDFIISQLLNPRSGKKAYIFFCILLEILIGLKLSAQSPSCNLKGPLKACLNKGNLEVNAEIEFSTPNPTLNYILQNNTTGASIVSVQPFVYDMLTGSGKQKVILNPGNTTGQIQIKLFVNTAGGNTECSASITIVNTTASSSFTPIPCYGDKSTLTVTAGGAGNFSYTYTLIPGDITIGPQSASNPAAVFPNLQPNSYTVTIKGSNECIATTSQTITQPPPNPGDNSFSTGILHR